ncbi:MAG: glycosyltransferase family 2 protein [Flavobacteriaceae bacterium]|nr:glycosyltransferase family 2 protein [Flavobacteriaceae bacterium]
MLTIGIPTYNYAIDTLLVQIYEQCEVLKFTYEIIVVDDASTNADIREINDKATRGVNARYIRQAENLGRTATRDTIADLATYDWILFMDADTLPHSQEFIAHYQTQMKLSVDAVFGGIIYEDAAPPENKMLRWKYGRAREVKSAEKRAKNPYVSVVSASFLIRKHLFKNTNPHTLNSYGLDIRFAQRLSEEKATIVHINNPVLHLGLESNEVFIKKSIEGVKILARLSKQDDIPSNFRPLQRFYRKLKRWKILRSFMKMVRANEQAILKNLNSKQPSLFMFDMLRVYHYAKQMKND